VPRPSSSSVDVKVVPRPSSRAFVMLGPSSSYSNAWHVSSAGKWHSQMCQ
jgi:hypothetical protein